MLRVSMDNDHHYTVLARLDTLKSVRICAHGTDYLIWGMATFRFSPHDFSYLVQVLDQKAGMLDDVPFHVLIQS